MISSPTDQFVVEWQFPVDEPENVEPTIVLTINVPEALRPTADVTLVRV